MTNITIILGLALFIWRSQLLRTALIESGNDPAKLHASPGLGAASGWASLAGAALLAILAVLHNSLLGVGLVVILGIAAGIALSALMQGVIGKTMALGHLSGEGAGSIAAFNRQYGAYIAFAVPALALLAWWDASQ
jgi:hypothetical protein